MLGDDDERAVGLVKASLVQAGMSALPVLRDLLVSDDERVARLVREVIASIERDEAYHAFEEICGRCQEFDLETCAWALARVFEPSADLSKYRARLDEWAEDAREAVVSAKDAEGRVLALAASMAGRHGLRGNVEDYYSPANSLLTSVVDSRFGNPITLSVLYILVARRIGMQVVGVNMPGHFIVRHEHVHFDPFHGGHILGIADIREILARQGTEPHPVHFQTVPTPAILLRMLGNLERIFRDSGDVQHAKMLKVWICKLQAGIS